MTVKDRIGKSKYNDIHDWLKKHYKKPKNCTRCKRNDTGRIEWACIGKYEKNIRSFVALCKSCHRRMDLGFKLGHCGYGHRMTEKNTYRYPNKLAKECRTCRKSKTHKRPMEFDRCKCNHYFHEGRCKKNRSSGFGKHNKIVQCSCIEYESVNDFRKRMGTIKGEEIGG